MARRPYKDICSGVLDEKVELIEEINSLRGMLQSESAQRAQAEEALKRSEQRCRSLADYIDQIAPMQELWGQSEAYQCSV